MKMRYSFAISGINLFIILFIFYFSNVFADDIVDEINITVPVSCSLSGTGMNTHTANIQNGQTNSNIGTTNFKATCNDVGGFAIYAIGYTDDTDGKNVLTSSVLGSDYDIVTGTSTSDDSTWSMKLAAVTSPTPAYPITIENSFNNFHAVPDDYTLVAKRTSSTDVGTSATGSTFTSTYQAHISPTQAAGTYTGKVKYVLVHPNTAPEPLKDNQIEVIYDGNGLSFENGSNTNRIVYERSCEDEYGYIGSTPAILKTDNLDHDGMQNGSYDRGSEIYLSGDDVYFENADKLKIEIYYKINNGTNFYTTYGEGAGDFECNDESGCEGTLTFVVNDTYTSIYYYAHGETTPGYDYGIYASVYPIYDEPTEGATYGLVQTVCSYLPITGTYSETTTWNGYWVSVIDNQPELLYDENEVTKSLELHNEDLAGTTVRLNSANTYTVVFDANGGSGTTNNQEIYPYEYTSLDGGNFTYPHKDVVSWNTKADGTGESYLNDPNSYSVYEPIANSHGGESVTLYAQWGECRPHNVCYDDNNANSSTTMGRQNTNFENGLWASNFQRNGYGFAGWNTRANGSGTYYGPNQTPGFSWEDLNREGIRLYAIWVPSAGNLQNWSGCSNLNVGSVTALTDLRDNNVYAVAKLADGNCWMIENLRLEARSTRGNTNKNYAQGYATSTTYGDFIGLADSETDFSNSNTANSLYYRVTQSGTATIDIGTLYSEGRFPRYNNENTSSSQSGTDYNKLRPTYSMGNYYTWSAAMANTIYYASATYTDENGKTSETVNTSICPTGWRIPYGRNTGNGAASGGFYNLDVALRAGQSLDSSEASNRWRSYPNNFVFSGYRKGSNVYNRGMSGTYWSSTANGYNHSQSALASLTLIIYVDRVVPASTSYPRTSSDGSAVRCVMISN